MLTGNINTNLIEKCPYDKVFDEEKQQCVKAESMEDLTCLVRLNMEKLKAADLTTTTSTKTTTTTTRRPEKKKSTQHPKIEMNDDLKQIFEALDLDPHGFYSDEEEDNNEEEETTRVPKKSNKKGRESSTSRPHALSNKRSRSESNRSNKLRKKSSDVNESDAIDYSEDNEEEYYYDEDGEEKKNEEKDVAKEIRVIKVEPKEEWVNSTESESQSDENKSEQSEEEIDENKYKRMCVVTNWSQYRSGRGRFQFDFIEPYLCNYVVYTSVKIEEEEDPDYEDFILKGVQHNEKGIIKKRVHSIYL